MLLALDTALGACSAALLDPASGRLIASACEPMTTGHAERLMPMVAELLEGAGVAPADLTRLAATVGPGSFTGIRVAVAAARGLALTLGKPVVGVSTLSALAAHLLDAGESVVAPAIDARHAHVYMALLDAGGRMLAAPAYRSAAEAARIAASTPAALVGSGATAMAAAWPPGISPARIDPVAFADIAWVARLAAAADPTTAPARPLYLKPPEAKPASGFVMGGF